MAHFIPLSLEIGLFRGIKKKLTNGTLFAEQWREYNTKVTQNILAT